MDSYDLEIIFWDVVVVAAELIFTMKSLVQFEFFFFTKHKLRCDMSST